MLSDFSLIDGDRKTNITINHYHNGPSNFNNNFGGGFFPMMGLFPSLSDDEFKTFLMLYALTGNLKLPPEPKNITPEEEKSYISKQFPNKFLENNDVQDVEVKIIEEPILKDNLPFTVDTNNKFGIPIITRITNSIHDLNLNPSILKDMYTYLNENTINTETIFIQFRKGVDTCILLTETDLFINILSKYDKKGLSYVTFTPEIAIKVGIFYMPILERYESVEVYGKGYKMNLIKISDNKWRLSELS